MTTVIVQDQNNVTVEVTPQPPINVIIDRGVSGPPGPPGDGDVNGPASSIANNVATFSDTTGKLIQDSGKAIPSGEIVGTTDTQPLTNKTISYDSNTMTGVQPTLVSGTSIKTVNSTSLLGSGNVSVGDIVGPASATDNAIVRFDGATGKLVQNSAVTIADDGTTIIDVSSTSAALRITQTGSGNAIVVEDSTNPDSTPFVVDANGRVLAGGSTAYTVNTITGRIQSQSSSVFDGGFASTIWSNDNNGTFVTLGKSRGAAIGTQAVVQANDSVAVLQFAGSDGTAFIEAARISANVDGTPGTNDMPGRLVFSTTADGASSPTERMRIDNAGRVGIGVTPNASNAFTVGGTLTSSSATSLGVTSNGTIPSTTTSAAQLFRSVPTTQASSFTLSALTHYYASQGTIGAGSSVSSQYGFLAESTITGATNNYGFYSNIASGTGRWNFYANGTAANYFAGSTTFADATAPVISAKIGPSSSQQHTLPAVTSDTVTLNAATQTLTNKTISYASNTLTGVQPTLVSGTSIKTINGNSLLGSGDLVISAGTGDVTGPASSVSGNVATFNGITGKVIQDGGKALPTGAIVGTTDSQALSGKTYNGLALAAAASGFTVAGGATSKTLTVNNTLGLSGTDGSTLDIGSGGTLGSAAYTATTAYAPATSGTAILKGNGSGGTVSAVAGTDYLAPPTGTAILKANAGGALANAVAGTDYQAAITASGLLKGAGGGSVSAAAAGTDYLAPPTGTALLKANSGGALANAVAGTDYLAPPTGTSILKANSGGALANAVAGTDYVAPGGALGTPSSGILSSCTVDGTNEVGYKNIPQNSQSAAYTLVIGDAGKHILHPSADTTARVFTIPANSSVAYPIGTAITFVNQNGAGAVTISITTDTMRLAGAGTTGSRTLAANGVATAIKITSTEWIISGTGLT